MPGPRRPLVEVLARRSLADDTECASEMVAAGRVTVGGAPATNPARLVADSEPVHVLPLPPPYVSRAGAKLAAALARFDLDPSGWRCVDVGASTGGFTDCLVQAGAGRVAAIDVGRGQLADRLADHPSVVVVDRCNVRLLAPQVGEDDDSLHRRQVLRDRIGPPADLVVVDVSFVSLAGLVDALLSLLAEDGRLVALVKPQFEATRREADLGRGVVDDPVVWRRVLEEVCSAFDEAGAAMMDAMASPVVGTRGNYEFLVLFARTDPGTAPTVADRHALLDAAVAEASAGPGGATARSGRS